MASMYDVSELEGEDCCSAAANCFCFCVLNIFRSSFVARLNSFTASSTKGTRTESMEPYLIIVLYGTNVDATAIIYCKAHQFTVNMNEKTAHRGLLTIRQVIAQSFLSEAIRISTL